MHVNYLFQNVAVVLINHLPKLKNSMTLARREMALVLSSIIIKYDIYQGQEGPTMELYETDRARDVDPHSDYIIPLPADGSQGVRIRFRA